MPGVMDLIWPGAFIVQSINVVARLGIAESLGPEPRTAEELAGAAQVHAPSLRRVLRALSVRTGTPPFRRLYGEPFFAWTKTHPEDGALFNAAISSSRCRPAVTRTSSVASFTTGTTTPR